MDCEKTEKSSGISPIFMYSVAKLHFVLQIRFSKKLNDYMEAKN